MHGNTISLTGWGQKWYYGLSRTTLYTNSFKLDIAKVMERREGGGIFIRETDPVPVIIHTVYQI